MQTPPIPANDAQRLVRLHGLGILDTLPQKAFDDISAMAQMICGTPVALITLIDKDRQWSKSRIGVEAVELPRELAFCSHAILEPDKVMMVEDLSQDPRFSDNPLVAGPTNARFYAGAPIVTGDGFAMGTVCVVDLKARTLDAAQLDALRRLSSLVSTLFEHEKDRLQEAEKSAAAARLAHEELTAMAIAGLDLQVYVDANYVYQHVNDTFLSYWACGREDIIGRSVASHVGEEAFRTILQPALATALTGEPHSYNRKVEFPGCGIRHVEVALLPARGPNGEITGVVMRAQDVQEIREREAHLRQTVALLEQKTLEQERFIHIISHDLREPINTINNFTSLLVSDHQQELTATAQRYLSFVQSGGQRMSFLLDDLLHFVRLDNHAVKIRPVEVSRLMQQLQNDLAGVIFRVGGRIDCAPQPLVIADESLLRIVLQNLATNGLKFSRRGVAPVVHISVEQGDGFHNVHVTDNGIGIASDHQIDIFDMFKRLHTRKQYEGSGLGLSICRRIAHLHGGRMSVQSTLGEGSRFTLHLPAAHAASHLE
ncbi:GAF domain-containing sensor histidine kinase [Hydrogenophaga sp. PBL-H3]|uniref:GAF domain-containing sensor histidine kinase n=1 Tax=Hydrogenophaga sp. PBL-H3 TaxID=434010 RepID=UPI00132018C2|nr:ATP-binding protein [Hydrogenophaga sp. PBL-H3]QHE76388.1 PAS domain-containing protein [Hydrogenophaga sp. PBL-H3]QHE80812.1 PAS domain-containing protein [Hydrogenophaga sp. PBL-H3]